jgi:AraC family transcriptional activator of tynA and feaB
MFERWSTAHLAAPQRTECFRAMLVHRGCDRLALDKVEAPLQGISRTLIELVRGGRQCLVVNLALSGRCKLRQFGREVIARPGELLLIDSSAPYELEQPDDVDLLSLAVPHPMLGKLLPAGVELVARRLPESASAALLANQLRTLAQWPHQLNAAEAEWLSDLLVGMVRAVIAAAAAPTAAALLRRH